MSDAEPTKILEWIRSRVELGTVVSVLVGAITYVGRTFYGSYFGFYSLSAADVEISSWDNLRIAAFVLALSSLLIVLVYRSRWRNPERFIDCLRDNVPLFVIVLMLTIIAVSVYATNVESTSQWIDSLISNRNLADTNRILTSHVESALRWLVLLAPIPTAAMTVLLASWRRWSFSRFLMERSGGFRLIVLTAYLAVSLLICSIWGRAVAFCEFVGLLETPQIVITLNEGHTFQPSTSLYLISRNGSLWCLAERSSGRSKPINVWMVPQASIKIAQTIPGSTGWSVFREYFK